jgi:hypothetical protein
MFTKSRILALGVAIAGAIGLGAPIASAATTATQPGNNGAAVNTVTGQVQSLGCGNVLPGNAVPGNVLPGNATGTKPANGEAVAGSLPLNSTASNSTVSNSTGSNSTGSSGISCGMVTKQIQSLVCGATPGSAVVSQVPAGPFTAVVAMLTQGAVSSAASTCSLSGK